MQNALQTSYSEATSAKLILAAENSANRSFADLVSEDDVCTVFCIPPIYTKNFEEKHFFFIISISEAYFCLKTTQKVRRGMQGHLYLVFFSN